MTQIVKTGSYLCPDNAILVQTLNSYTNMEDNRFVKLGKEQLSARLGNANTGEGPEDELFKIPIEVLHKLALREIGEQEALIDELKDTIQKLTREIARLKASSEQLKQISKEERVAIKREELYERQRKRILEQNKQIKYLHENNGELVAKIVSLQRTIDELRSRQNN